MTTKELITKIVGEEPYVIGMKLYAGEEEVDINYQVDENGFPLFDKPINYQEALEKMLLKLQKN